jgi:hypothetical protein
MMYHEFENELFFKFVADITTLNLGNGVPINKLATSVKRQTSKQIR